MTTTPGTAGQGMEIGTVTGVTPRSRGNSKKKDERKQGRP
jgi:hypothetical protein